ncbi:MAG TPA: 4-phosphoerythronate dehydrogenase [Candidatus Kryptonia bacterium]
MKFIVDRNIPLVQQAFEGLGDVTALETGDFTKDTVRDADVLVVRSETKVNAALLDGSCVKFVGTATIGTDHIDLDYLQSRGIGFASAPGSNSNSVKEYVAAALLHLAAREKYNLKGRTIGVVGVGNVGSKVVKAAEALGLHVVQNDPPLAERTGDKHFVGLDDALKCDIVTLHVPLTKEGSHPTFHLIGSEQFAKMKKDSVFINTSRGAVVDTTALKKAIRDGNVSGSVIDVWEHEPLIDCELLYMVSLSTPHIAGYSTEGKVNAVTAVRKAVCEHFKIKSEWDPHDLIGPPPVPDVKVSPDEAQPEEILDLVVSEVYDITYDNTHLQQLVGMPEKDRAGYFRKLRSGYRVRREFSNTTVHLPREHAGLSRVLSSLGFKLNV